MGSHEGPFKDLKIVGKVSLTKNWISYPITILEDTGAAQSVLCKSTLPARSSLKLRWMERKSSGRAKYLNLNFTNIFFTSPSVSGQFKVGVLEKELPIKGVSLIFSNDLTCSLVLPKQVVVETPLELSPTKKLDERLPHILPVCAVTCSWKANLDDTTTKIVLPDLLTSKVLFCDTLIKALGTNPTLVVNKHFSVTKD